ncbi:hypothetical protein [uncultured Jannaschia sp.]|uniref:hypothetical protein n=1 Tax=uncultured Jannaschia sp. TaxID=293347 RepID=UPI00261EBBA1|nr:hypothetical protein [uncultured Jannaschia sp.]
MPIQNTKVPSSELMARRRARRLNKGSENAGDDPTTEPTNPVMANLSEEVRPSLDDNEQDAPANDETKDASVEHDKAMQADVPGSADQEHASGAGAEGSGPEKQTDPEQSPKSRREKSGAKGPARQDEAGSIKLHMNLPVIARGTSPTFDEITELQGEKLAFRLVLGKAVELYVDAVMDGAPRDMTATYQEGSTMVATTRTISKSAYDVLTKELNRTGLLSRYAMGTLIGRRALATFVARDKRLD